MERMKIFFLLLAVVFLFSPVYANEFDAAIKLVKEKNYGDAADILEEITKKDTDNASAFLNLGFCYMMTGDYEQALLNYQKADSLFSGFDSRAGIQWALLSLGRFEESLQAGERVLELTPKNYTINIRIAYAYYASGKYKEAEEAYKNLISVNGNTPDLLFGLGLSEYHSDKEEEGYNKIEQGYKMDNSHQGIRRALGLYPKEPPYIEFTPYYAGYQFKNSSFVGSGAKAGGDVAFGFEDSFRFNLGYYHDNAQNLNSSKGVNNYITNQYNLLYFYTSLPAAPPAGAPALPATAQPTIQNYLQTMSSPYNLYQISTLLNSSDYSTAQVSGGVTYRNSYDMSFRISGNYITSNSNYLDKGSTGQFSGSFGTRNILTIAAAYIHFPKSSGGQFSPSFSWNIFWNFRSETTITLQQMAVTTTEYQIYSLKPVSTYSSSATTNKSFGSVTQGISYSWKYFTFGLGGRVGSNMNPLFGDYLVYTPSQINSGYYATATIHYFHNATLTLNFSHDSWKNSANESPTSNQGRVMFTMRLP